MQQLAESVQDSLWFEDEDPHHSEFEASNSLSAQVARLTGLKPFPEVARKVTELVASPDCNIGVLTKVIRNDPAIAAKLMRLSNSALFRTGEPAESLDQALVRLGTSTIYQMVTALGVMGLFPGTNSLARTVRDHCVGVGAIAQELARFQGYAGASQLFLCGLMHDLGKLLLMQSGELDYDQNGDEPEPEQTHRWEREELGYDHAVLGGHVMALWGMPEMVCQVVAWHHQPERAYLKGGDTASLVAYVVQADRMEGLVCDHPDAPPTALEPVFDTEGAERTGVDCELLRQRWSHLVEVRQVALSSM